MVIKLSPRVKQILQVFEAEYEKVPRGAIVRTAKIMGITKQYVKQAVDKSGITLIPSPKTFECRVCNHKLEIKYKAGHRRNTCVYCAEIGLRKCKCGNMYFGDAKVCPECNYKHLKRHLSQIKEGTSKSHLGLTPEQQRRRKLDQHAKYRRKMLERGAFHDLCSCGNRKAKKSKICRTCFLKQQASLSKRPAPEILNTMIKESGYTKTARAFGVAYNTIKKWEIKNDRT